MTLCDAAFSPSQGVGATVTGRGRCSTATKLSYPEEYERRRKDHSIKHPEHSMLQEKGKFPGIWSGCFSKWRKQRKHQNWPQLCSNLVGTAKKAKQVPQWALAAMQVPQKGSGRTPGFGGCRIGGGLVS